MDDVLVSPNELAQKLHSLAERLLIDYGVETNLAQDFADLIEKFDGDWADNLRQRIVQEQGRIYLPESLRLSDIPDTPSHARVSLT